MLQVAAGGCGKRRDGVQRRADVLHLHTGLSQRQGRFADLFDRESVLSGCLFDAGSNHTHFARGEAGHSLDLDQLGFEVNHAARQCGNRPQHLVQGAVADGVAEERP